MGKQVKQLKITEVNESKLKGDSIIAAINNLQRAVEKKFPDRGLKTTIVKLKEEAIAVNEASQYIDRLNVGRWTWCIGVPILLFCIIIYSVVKFLDFGRNAFNGFDDVDGLINLMFLCGVIGLFLFQYLKVRRRTFTLKQLHRIRTLVHVLDMKQQNKKYHNKCLTNKRPLTPEENITYLDDCSQALSLAGKVAALTIEGHDDSLVIAAVSEIDSLCNGISSKIWQKIFVLQAHINDGNP